MVKGDLSFVADALLALCESDRRPRCLTDEKLEAKIQRDRRKAEALAEALLPEQAAFMLFEEECAGIVAQADLTERQLDVLTLRLEGDTFEEIGTEMGFTKQAAQNIFIQAIKKLRAAYHVYSFTGLSEVYRNELYRGLSGGFGTMRG